MTCCRWSDATFAAVMRVAAVDALVRATSPPNVGQSRLFAVARCWVKTGIARESTTVDTKQARKLFLMGDKDMSGDLGTDTEFRNPRIRVCPQISHGPTTWTPETGVVSPAQNHVLQIRL